MVQDYFSPGRINPLCRVRIAHLTTIDSIKIENLRPGL